MHVLILMEGCGVTYWSHVLSFVIWGSAHLPGHSGGPVSCDRTGEAGIMERMILGPVQLGLMGPQFYLCGVL